MDEIWAEQLIKVSGEEIKEIVFFHFSVIFLALIREDEELHETLIILYEFLSVELELRTVPTIVIAHTFYASRDTRISSRRCLIIQGYFCTVQNYAEKAELSKCSWYPKRK